MEFRISGGMEKVMRRLLYAIIVLGISPAFAMQRQGVNYNPFLKLPASNTPQILSEEQLLTILKRGNFEDLQYQLANRLNPNYRIENGEYKGKTLIQVVWLASINNRYEMADRLLVEGADIKDLNDYIKLAIRAYNPDQVKWLIDRGAKDDGAYEVVERLLRVQKDSFKNEQLVKILEILKPRKSLVTPIVRRVTNAEPRRTKLPVIEMDESQYRKPLPPIPQDKNGK